MQTETLPYVVVEARCKVHGAMRRAMSPHRFERTPRHCPQGCGQPAEMRKVGTARHPSEWAFAGAEQMHPIAARKAAKHVRSAPAGESRHADATRVPQASSAPDAARLACDRAEASGGDGHTAAGLVRCATEGCAHEAQHARGLCLWCYQRALYRQKHPHARARKPKATCTRPGCTRQTTTGALCAVCQRAGLVKAALREYRERRKAGA